MNRSPLEIHRTEQIPRLCEQFEENQFLLVREKTTGCVCFDPLLSEHPSPSAAAVDSTIEKGSSSSLRNKLIPSTTEEDATNNWEILAAPAGDNDNSPKSAGGPSPKAGSREFRQAHGSGAEENKDLRGALEDGTGAPAAPDDDKTFQFHEILPYDIHRNGSRASRKRISGRVGIVLSGRNSIAAGILNVIVGLFSYLKKNQRASSAQVVRSASHDNSRHQDGSAQGTPTAGRAPADASFVEQGGPPPRSLPRANSAHSSSAHTEEQLGVGRHDNNSRGPAPAAAILRQQTSPAGPQQGSHRPGRVELLGYVGGPKGFLQGRCKRIAEWSHVKSWLNQGGCAAFSYSPTEDFADVGAVLKRCESDGLEHLVLIGGPHCLPFLLKTIFPHLQERNIGFVFVPKSKNANFYFPYYMPVTLGFDSSRRMLAELVGNIAVDTLSSNKYWHFIRCGD
eukprot:g9190.t1